jgi:hypothetical protein
MIVTIYSDEDLNGKFLCEFNDSDKKYYLNYDLDNWVCTQENGLIGGNYIHLFRPQEIKMTFDIQYEMSIEEARKVYETLMINGWT